MYKWDKAGNIEDQTARTSPEGTDHIQKERKT